MKLIMTALMATAITLTAPLASAQTEIASETASASQTLITAKVNGMVCDFCARAVTKVFSKEDAVETVHVDLGHGEIHVTLRPGAEISDDTVKTLVTKSGYDLVSIERETT